MKGKKMANQTLNVFAEKVCMVQGHDISSYPSQPAFDVKANKVVDVLLFCRKCAMTPEEIKSYREVHRRSRGPNKSRNGDNPIPGVRNA